MRTTPNRHGSDPRQTPPPPRKGLRTGLVILAAVLVLGLIVVAVGTIFYNLQVPVLSNLFPARHPASLAYNNSFAGISLTYPGDWLYKESGDAVNGYTVFFATSQGILDDPSHDPQDGAIMVVSNAMHTSDLAIAVDPAAMTKVIEDLAANSTNFGAPQNLHNFTLSGFPAASGIYPVVETTVGNSMAYVVAALRNDEVIMIFGACRQSQWAQYQSVMESIINSVVITQH